MGMVLLLEAIVACDRSAQGWCVGALSALGTGGSGYSMGIHVEGFSRGLEGLLVAAEVLHISGV